MNRRVPVIAQRDIAKLELCHHRHFIESQTNTHSTALTAAAAVKRDSTVIRRIDQVTSWAGCGAAGP